MRYSKTTGNFYPEEINYASLPDDIINVSHDDYAMAMNRAENESFDFVNNKLVVTLKPGPSIEEQWYELQTDARKELSKSDITILRCIENSVTFPSSWATYRSSLRAIISSPTGDPSLGLPTKPTYPAGT